MDYVGDEMSVFGLVLGLYNLWVCCAAQVCCATFSATSWLQIQVVDLGIFAGIVRIHLVAVG